MTATRTIEEVGREITAILAWPPHRAFGLVLVSRGPGEAVLAFDAGEACLGPSGQVHGGVISMLAEPSAVLALLPMLPADRHAVTADFHAQFLRPAKPLSRVELTGRVVKAGRQLAFARSRRALTVRFASSCG